jgi:hypothetical protein
MVRAGHASMCIGRYCEHLEEHALTRSDEIFTFEMTRNGYGRTEVLRVALVFSRDKCKNYYTVQSICLAED